MAYLLEAQSEFDRLERQSQHPSFDYKVELRNLVVTPRSRILDAGCGSGIVCRYLAGKHADARIVGCDLAEARIEMAKKAASSFSNLEFQIQNLSKLSFETAFFDVVICRFVLQHLSAATRDQAMSEMLRVLKPGGQIYIVDTDALLMTLYPQTKLVAETLAKILAAGDVDCFIGRKLPSLLLEEGFDRITWEIDATGHDPAHKASEAEMMRERFVNALPYYAKLLNSEKDARQFMEDYVGAMEKPGAVYYQNKFLLSAFKPSVQVEKKKLRLL